MQTFKGDFTVEPLTFRLRAERMTLQERPIIRDNKSVQLRQISFDLLYTYDMDTPEEHPLKGTAYRQSEGHYESHFGRETEHAGTVIYILRAKVHKDGDECFVEGFWFEKDEGVYKFSGNLGPLDDEA